jgi:hypothetical protein
LPSHSQIGIQKPRPMNCRSGKPLLPVSSCSHPMAPTPRFSRFFPAESFTNSGILRPVLPHVQTLPRSQSASPVSSQFKSTILVTGNTLWSAKTPSAVLLSWETPLPSFRIQGLGVISNLEWGVRSFMRNFEPLIYPCRSIIGLCVHLLNLRGPASGPGRPWRPRISSSGSSWPSTGSPKFDPGGRAM